MNESKSRMAQVIVNFLVVMNAVFIVFVINLQLTIRDQIAAVQQQVADVEQVSAAQISGSPFSVLEERCTECHSERRFTAPHNGSDISGILKSMKGMPDAQISSHDINKIHTAMKLLECVRCHDQSTLARLKTLSPEKQREYILTMREKPGSTIREEDINEIMAGLQQVQGF